jgi:hypothetical protein
MTDTKTRILRVALATIVGVGCLFVIGIRNSGHRGSRDHWAPPHADELCRRGAAHDRTGRNLRRLWCCSSTSSLRSSGLCRSGLCGTGV